MRRLLTLVIGLLLVPGAVAATAAPARASHEEFRPANYPVMVRNLQTYKCATVAGGSRTDNNWPLVQYDCDSHASRRWIFTRGPSGFWWIKNAQTAKCMTFAGGTLPDNNIQLVQYDCDTHASRLWRVVKDGCCWRLQNSQSWKCATVAGGSRTDNN